MTRSRIIAKCQAYVRDAHNGNWYAAFHHFANAEGRIGKPELIRFLDAAGIGEVYAGPILGVLDRNKDRVISYEEFQDALGEQEDGR